MKVWWVWQVGLTGEGKEQRRGDATTSLRRCDTAIARNPYLPGGLRRQGRICGVGAS